MKQSAFPSLQFPFVGHALRLWRYVLVGLLLSARLMEPVYAGGGGENMLLIVNPNDEPSLRIANAYAQARHIPVNNILFLAPTAIQGFTNIEISPAQFTSTYQTAVPAAIAARGLTNQIDYIGTIGHPHRVDSTLGNFFCVHDCLNQLTQLQNGMAMNDMDFRNSELYFPQTSAAFNYVHGTNTAIYHSTKHTPVGTSGTASYAKWYMSGMIGYAGHEGLTTTQVIQNLQRTIASDGTKPGGTMYFEQSSDVQRTGARSPYWPPVQTYMSANNIPWIDEALNGGYTAVPVNRRDVRGAEIGSPVYGEPSGCIYLPGSWADSLTSTGGCYGSVSGQTTAANVLLAGGGGSSGTIAEPGADADRFPTTALTVYSNDGSTLGEAFYKTVKEPDMVMFQGDLLSQAYADIPSVAFTSAPADGATVSGSVTLSGSAALPNLTSQSTATGIASLRLFVDGKDTGAFVTGPSGAFILNTPTLTDGIHEVRLVAYNNSAAASEGCAIRNFLVNNLGQSVSVTSGSSYNVASTQTLFLPLSATQGSGPAITGIQLQSLGRVVGSFSGLSGTVSLSGTSLAYGNNTVIPVALLSGSQQVQGQPITVIRRFQPLVGTASTPLARRNPGFDYYYYPGVAQKTMAATNFSGTPAYVQHSYTLQIVPDNTDATQRNMPDPYCTTAGGANAGLAVMVKGAFTVTTAGEYSFSFSAGNYCLWTSLDLSIDGVSVLSYDCWNGNSLNLLTSGADTLRSVYLLPGEHALTVKLANVTSNGTSTPDKNMYFQLQFRGLDANVRGTNAMSYNNFNTSGYATGPFFYTAKKNVGH